ncbi:hypothetical protein EDB92DRAFT_2091842 [Lactarius akahatsu]|uniref:Uncharacterized protein n=1 Tax=Lactarius akahatsu TaxID=416441 RepID=A0AAD4L962_9AGAM|nr:hypothetical protein EDB92DRAFT_2091842 [Lactarius akahatsu]
MPRPLPLPGPVSLDKSVPSAFRVPTISTVPRRARGSFLAFLLLAAITLFYLHSIKISSRSVPNDLLPLWQDIPPPEGGPNPPRFYKWHEREKQLPQHDPDLPYPQGREGRYIRFSNQIFGLGWGNAMQEFLFNAHLAYLSNRIYVFDNYTWDKTPGDFSSFNGKPIPARVPLTALLSGPIAGDPFPSSAVSPPAVIPEFFNEVCPNRTIIDREAVNAPLSGASAATILQAWLNLLERTEDRCIEVKEYSGQIFDFMLFGDSSRLLDIWPSLAKSPILTHFSWSPLIITAIVANANVIHPALSSATPSSFTPSSHPAPLSGLLALHIRRGDYIDHCMNLANWSARFMGFNEFPGLPDRLEPPGEVVRYREHCFPEIAQIVTRVREVRAALLPATPLSRVYVLTNGRPEWLAKLKEALQKDARSEGLDEWAHIGTSRDLWLTREQQHNAQAMDMAVAQRAEVFLGNGFSSLTSNVVMLRAAQGYEWDKTRFW